MCINIDTSFSKEDSLELPVFPEEFVALCLGTAVLLTTQLDSDTIPFSQEKLQAALQKLMENEKRCDEWQDDLQQQRADWEASGTLPKGVSLMPKRDLDKKLLGSLHPGIW